jgi:hypothetical protein
MVPRSRNDGYTTETEVINNKTNNKTSNKQTTMHKQQSYVPPGIEIYRVIMETTIADTTVSVQTLGKIDDWKDGGTIGAASGEGGDVLILWN